jgi:hypothetical protein
VRTKETVSYFGTFNLVLEVIVQLDLCSMVLKKTLSYNVNNQTPVFCTFLDASKAFDRIHYGKLFDSLIKCNLPACIIRVLINLYTHNLLRERWNGVDTDYFSAVNGVKQSEQF